MGKLKNHHQIRHRNHRGRFKEATAPQPGAAARQTRAADAALSQQDAYLQRGAVILDPAGDGMDPIAAAALLFERPSDFTRIAESEDPSSFGGN